MDTKYFTRHKDYWAEARVLPLWIGFWVIGPFPLSSLRGLGSSEILGHVVVV